MRSTRIRAIIALVLAVVALAGFISIHGSGQVKSRDVTLVTHDSFVMSPALVKEFDKSSGYTLHLLTAGDAGSLTNKLILTQGAPIADAVFGIDNTLSGEAVANHLVAGSLIPTDFGDVCFNYDKLWFSQHHIAAPVSIGDLIKPAYKSLTVVENPATSSTGLAFLAVTVAKFGESGWSKYWQALKSNSVKVDDGWEAAYYTDFSGSSGKGAYPIVLSYATSPADEVRSNGQSQTASIMDGCFKQTEYAGVLQGAKNSAGAKAVINFLLGHSFQNTFPSTMYMYPITQATRVPTDWTKFAPNPTVTYGDHLDFNANRGRWLATWAAIFG